MRQKANCRCFVCYYRYDQASARGGLLLPCGHDFCRCCLQNHENNSNKNCPKCRSDWSSVWVADLPDYTSKEVRAERSCDTNEPGGEEGEEDDRVCKIHGVGLHFWCQSCKEIACPQSLRATHKKCEWILLEESTTDIKQHVEQKVEKATAELAVVLKEVQLDNANCQDNLTNLQKFMQSVQKAERYLLTHRDSLTSLEKSIKRDSSLLTETNSFTTGGSVEALRRCQHLVGRLAKTEDVPQLPKLPISSIAAVYMRLDGLSGDDDFFKRFISEMEKNTLNPLVEALTAEEGRACGEVSSKSICKTIPDTTPLVKEDVLRGEEGRLGHVIGPLRSSGPGGLLSHVRLLEEIGKVNTCRTVSGDVCIGIDLGMTNSCVAVVRNGRVDIICNDRGNRTTPSFVGFTEDEALVGDAAKAQATWNPENTVFDAKRLIGRKYNDPRVQKCIKKWPFQVKNHNGIPKIEVEYKGANKTYTPEEISSMVLMKMKEIADDYVGKDVKDAVITVPASFDDSQRQATMDAGAIAGLNVLSIINEPIAAAIANCVHKIQTDRRNIFVFNIGGGVLEVTVLAVENGSFHVLAVNGDTYLGGGDFDDRLMNHFIAEFKRKKKVDISGNARAMAKLRKACEMTKRNLSSSIKDRIQIECLYQNVDFDSSITRPRFEELCSDLFEGTMSPVAAVLEDAGLTKNDIDEVVMAGGSTRIPKIQQLLQKFFDGTTLNKTINPDEVLAFGAALKAENIARKHSRRYQTPTNVTAQSIGVPVQSGKMMTFIECNTNLPAQNTIRFTTTCDNQTAVDIKVYEGEHVETVYNRFVGEFTMEGIQVALKGVPQIDVTFSIDRNGILNVTAVDNSTSAEQSITITSNKGPLGEDDISRMVGEAKSFQEDAVKSKERTDARSSLESFCLNMKEQIEQMLSLGQVSQDQFTQVDDACDDAITWVDDHQRATKEDYLAKKTEIDSLCASISGFH